MKLEKLKDNWETLGQNDAYWAVLTNPSKINNKWDLSEFYQTGRNWVNAQFEKFDLDQLLTQKEIALDFGCGPGRLTQGLCPKFKNVIGTDISSSMIEKAKKNNRDRDKCTYTVNSSNDLSQFDTDQFDFVLSLITLQHVEKRYMVNYIREFSRVVKQGGHILFNLPSKPPFVLKLLLNMIGSRGVNLIRKMYYRKTSVIEMHWIEKNEMIELLEEMKLEIINISEDKSVGKDWESFLYLLRKPVSSKD